MWSFRIRLPPKAHIEPFSHERVRKSLSLKVKIFSVNISVDFHMYFYCKRPWKMTHDGQSQRIQI